MADEYATRGSVYIHVEFLFGSSESQIFRLILLVLQLRCFTFLLILFLLQVQSLVLCGGVLENPAFRLTEIIFEHAPKYN